MPAAQVNRNAAFTVMTSLRGARQHRFAQRDQNVDLALCQVRGQPAQLPSVAGCPPWQRATLRYPTSADGDDPLVSVTRDASFSSQRGVDGGVQAAVVRAWMAGGDGRGFTAVPPRCHPGARAGQGAGPRRLDLEHGARHTAGARHG